ncbi:MAG: type II secretion system major pseudopilin GspG [Candidatus Poribacteria bacterium]|nr:type II secretion system major pseudopilin GspG [Candidatus Poribacteria bacterium]
MRKIHNSQSGLISTQLLVVIIIIGIVAAVVLAPRILGQAGKALQAQAAEEIETIGIALDTYAKDKGDYPSTEQELAALWEKPEKPPLPTSWVAPYLKIPIITDPWGNPYIYIRPGIHDRYGYDLISFGSDGREGGTGDAEDVVSWIRFDE